MFWAVADSVCQRTIQFAFQLIIARHISPSEFGSSAIALSFSGVLMVVLESWLTTSLIYLDKPDNERFSTLFWITILVGIVLAAAVTAIAPIAERIFSADGVETLMDLSALHLLGFALICTSKSILIAQQKFQLLFFMNLTASSLAVVFALLLVEGAAGAIALLAQPAFFYLFSGILLSFFCPLTPKLVINTELARSALTGFRSIVFAGFIDATYTKLTPLVLGKFLGAETLGFFVRANATKSIPIDLLFSYLGNNALCIFREASADLKTLHRVFRSTLKGIMFLIAPLCAGICASSDSLVVALYGEIWRQSAPLLQILIISVLFWPIHTLNLTILKALSETKYLVGIELKKKTFAICAIGFGLNFGVYGVATAEVLSSILALFVNCYHTKRVLGHGLYSQIVDIAPTIISSLIMYSTMSAVGSVLVGVSLYKLLAAQSVVGFVTFASMTYLFQPSALASLRQMASRRQQRFG